MHQSDVDDENSKEPLDSVDEQTVDQEKNEGGTKRSNVWDHFTFDKSAEKSTCHYCKKLIKAGTKANGTSDIWTHLKQACSKSPIYKKVDNKKQSKLAFKPKSMGEDGGSLASHTFSQEKCRKLLARMCIKDNLPFSVVDDEGLREFVWELNPLFKFPSRWTVARDCLSTYEEEKKKLKHLLKDQTVSLTTDTWTSVQNFNYMSLTAHWVDENWVLRKKILNFCQISNHKGETIGKLVYHCLRKWGIDRVFTVTVDNASSNDGAIKYLKKCLRVLILC
ncbi:putative transcription factor/ chromatin remodeling BED-type(Zn) family [Helianthus annuus]|nr:putative transcription factor/ chromatin remodeling BED-type(Zn) family [Helianthus annuus]